MVRKNKNYLKKLSFNSPLVAIGLEKIKANIQEDALYRWIKKFS